jgi:probable F420-dependent oxidoreductase
MEIETLLPMGKTDPGLRAPEMPLDLAAVGSDARLLERLGYDGIVFEETKDDPFVLVTLAAQATTHLKLATAVAIAFPRSPTITALSAWTLQKLSHGRFTLGLGSQVKGHIERRYGMTWSAAGPWMREYIQAVRAVWDCWQNGTPLNFAGEHYKLSLVVPLFNPGPIEHPRIPIHLAAVNPYMCRVAGEVADGLRPHPVCTPKYIREVMLPAVRKGAAIGQRSLAGFRIAMKALIATAPDRDALAAKMEDVRARVSFYASTPAYRAAFAAHGLGTLADELKELSRAQRWDEMPRHISDDVLHTYAVVGTYDEIADKLATRYGDIVNSLEFSIPAANDNDQHRLSAIARRLQELPPPSALGEA